MKRFLYIAFKDLSNPYYGGNSKVRSQCRAFSAYGFDVDLIGRFATETVCIRLDQAATSLGHHRGVVHHPRFRSLMDKHNQICDLISFLRDKKYDACYIRYDFSDPMFLRLLKILRPRCGKIVLELPTYPYEAENKYGILSKLRMAVDKCCRRQLHRYIDHIVTFYGGYTKLFGIPVLVISNGFDFSRMSLVRSDLPTDGIHLIAVSSMREWHGYERMIDGIRRYYQADATGKRNFVLHLVGKGRLYTQYKDLVEQYQLQDHIILEGAMHGEALQSLYERCALGVDSLARHRSGIHVLSSLKSREYAAKGLPIINSCKIDVIEDDFPYLLRVPEDETPIDMDAIAAFYDRCFTGEKTRQEVGQALREYMIPRSGMEQTLAPVVQWFCL